MTGAWFANTTKIDPILSNRNNTVDNKACDMNFSVTFSLSDKS